MARPCELRRIKKVVHIFRRAAKFLTNERAMQGQTVIGMPASWEVGIVAVSRSHQQSVPGVVHHQRVSIEEQAALQRISCPQKKLWIPKGKRQRRLKPFSLKNERKRKTCIIFSVISRTARQSRVDTPHLKTIVFLFSGVAQMVAIGVTGSHCDCVIVAGKLWKKHSVSSLTNAVRTHPIRTPKKRAITPAHVTNILNYAIG
jgi:hypothetical protein